jgi:acetoin utilization protein AcuB
VVDGRLAGIVTDRDLRDAFPSVFEHGRRREGTDPCAIPVEDVMTREVLTIAPDVPVDDGARLMRRERIGAIPVVDGRRLVGILTRSDVLDAFLSMSRNVPGGRRRDRASGARQSRAAGSVTVKTVRSPGVLATAIRPPMRSTASRQNGSPRPVSAAGSSVGDRRTVRNFSKMRA